MSEFNADHWAHQWFLEQGISESSASYLTLTIDLFLLIIICSVVAWIARLIVVRFVKSFARRSTNKYDDVFVDKKVFNALAYLIPALVVYYTLPYILDETGLPLELLQRLVTIYMVVILLIVLVRFLRAIEYIGLRTPKFQGKPISSYIQVFILLTYIVGGIFIISMVIGRSPVAILTAFGAATAIILLIFKDTILGLVASIQISANDMVRLGDWVTMEKYGADGDVIEINLTTVKIRNFDKTITTVPTYSFIADSFRNWRGMETVGVRRIKRSIHIDLSSIRFVDDTLRERFIRFERVREYVMQRQEEIDNYNKETGADKTELINGRHMTNLGVFRRYATRYLEEHPKIDKKETIMVRQLQPTENGIPLEVYAFSSDTAWVNYEGIQSDIFDHLLAAVEKFDLKVFQSPSGADLQKVNLSAS